MKSKFASVLYAIGCFLLVVLLHKIPLDTFLKGWGLSQKEAHSWKVILLNFVAIGAILFELKRRKLWSKAGLNFRKPRNPKVYLLLLLYLLFFTNGMSFLGEVETHQWLSYGVLLVLFKCLSIGIFEELLFRSLIQSEMLSKFANERNGLVKGVFLSAFLFGVLHLINLSSDHVTITLAGAVRQVFVAGCLGALFGAVLVRTGNVIPITIIHSAMNLPVALKELCIENTDAIPKPEQSPSDALLSAVFLILLFGSAALIGWFLLRYEMKSRRATAG